MEDSWKALPARSADQRNIKASVPVGFFSRRSEGLLPGNFRQLGVARNKRLTKKLLLPGREKRRNHSSRHGFSAVRERGHVHLDGHDFSRCGLEMGCRAERRTRRFVEEDRHLYND